MRFNTVVVLVACSILIGAPVFGVSYYRKITQPRRTYIAPREEITITILPGWNLRNIATYFVESGIASTTEDVYDVTGRPAVDHRLVQSIVDRVDKTVPVLVKPPFVSYEGYLAPETYRIYKDATVKEVVEKLAEERKNEVPAALKEDIEKSGYTWHEILTMASIIEREAKAPTDRALVSDILWRRLKTGMLLQVDSSVHYIAGRTGDVYTTREERESESPWNTYKYKGLPPGPICMPSIESIIAAVHPEKNSDWYFLTGSDGKMYYAHNFDEHQRNINRYLR